MTTLLRSERETVPARELRQLLGETGKGCVSLYLPIHERGIDIRQDTITLDNSIREAEHLLVEQGMDPLCAVKLLAPAHRLLGENLLWRHPNSAVALFVSPTTFRYYFAPTHLKREVAVGRHFHIGPLLPFLSRDHYFYLLALSLNRVTLFKGTDHTIVQVGLPQDVPASLEDFLKYDDFQVERGLYAGASERPGRQVSTQTQRASGAVYYGQGAQADVEQCNIVRYLQKIDKGLQFALHNESVPLVLAGVDHLLAMFRAVNSYRHLVKGEIRGNADNTRAEELRARAWDIVRFIYDQPKQQALERYMQLVGMGQTSRDLRDIVPAAFDGKVDTLFVGEGMNMKQRQKWGTFDESSRCVTLHERMEPGDEDLVEFAIRRTLLNDGNAYPLAAERFPGDFTVAALFRYS